MSAEALHLYLEDADATARLAEVLAATQPPAAVVFLHGDLGAGKSTLARAWLRALGVTGAVRSPTYTLVEPYALAAGGRALHLDLYRIGAPGELEFLGLDDPAGVALWLVEWPERGAAALPAPDLEVFLALADDAAGSSGPPREGRRARLAAGSDAGRAWLAAVDLNSQLRQFPESGPEEVAADHGN